MELLPGARVRLAAKERNFMRRRCPSISVFKEGTVAYVQPTVWGLLCKLYSDEGKFLGNFYEDQLEVLSELDEVLYY